tara:strand:- start:278 stop:1009 length:732 start_codon:yes stop_codon:yes gene_type:complete
MADTRITTKTSSKLIAVELVAMSPSITVKEIAEKVGCNVTVVRTWLRDPAFIDAWYKRYMEVAGAELPHVVGAMIREAKEGNVQAGRLILEHFGKLDTRVKIQVESPFEKFLNRETEDAEFEFVDNKEITNGAISVADQVSSLSDGMDDLPDRNIDNDSPTARTKLEKTRLDLATYDAKFKAREQRNQKFMYDRRKRAEAVGMELLGRGRSSKGKGDRWWDELEKKEIDKFGKVQGNRKLLEI